MKNNSLFGFVVLLFLLHSCVSPEKSFRAALRDAPYDVIIVPGIPYQDGDWSSNIMKTRVVWSCYLYSKGIARHIIYSGNAVYTPYIEGKIMAAHAIALGVPDSVVFSETKARHSTENLVYSYRMAERLGFKKIAVATDPFQSASLETFAWDYRFPVKFIPVVIDYVNAFRIDSAFHVDPSAAFVRDFVPLPQQENVVKRLMGTLGSGIEDNDTK